VRARRRAGGLRERSGRWLHPGEIRAWVKTAPTALGNATGA
jgi:hypothetical protein